MSPTGGSGGGRSSSGRRKWEEEDCYVAAYQLDSITWSSEFTLPQKSITIHVCRQRVIACNNNNMRNPTK